MNQAYTIPFVFSFVIHSVVLFYAGEALMQPDLALRQSISALELSLSIPQSTAEPTETIAEDAPEPEKAPQSTDENHFLKDITDMPVFESSFDEKEHTDMPQEPDSAKTDNTKTDCDKKQAYVLPPVDDLSHAAEAGVKNTMTEPDLFFNPAPKYPRLARKNGEEGLVLLEVSISSTGMVSDIIVVSTSGSARLDDSAVSTVSRWQFKPALHNDQPVSVRRIIPIVFKLK
jgi:periplasmic protein TonB